METGCYSTAEFRLNNIAITQMKSLIWSNQLKNLKRTVVKNTNNFFQLSIRCLYYFVNPYLNLVFKNLFAVGSFPWGAQEGSKTKGGVWFYYFVLCLRKDTHNESAHWRFLNMFRLMP